ncbi:MAG: alpha-glucan family phosphorylase [Acidobacteriota bacterium]
MNPIRVYSVVPRLPEPLACLSELAYNMRWSWHYPTIELFRRLDNVVWNESGRNPVRLLATISQAKLDAAAKDRGFLANLDRVWENFSSYMAAKDTWFSNLPDRPQDMLVAYFSAEFGLSEGLPIYSGGLGVLAGDHLKSASDLGLPLVAVGLLYQKGYFRQYLNNEGWQQEMYPVNDFSRMPVKVERDADGNPLKVDVLIGEKRVYARVWKAQVGRVPLLLLDTNIPPNEPAHRDITDELYGGDAQTRIQQEIVLGIGGMRALSAVGKNPTVCHMNEGHAAFLGLEWTRMNMASTGASFAEAREAASAGSVFTTHTPVPAGIDMFDAGMIEKYLGPYCRSFGLGVAELMELGRRPKAQEIPAPLNMAVLALRFSTRHNGVSKLHASVSREMWRELWPGVPVDEVPIRAVTNGVHPASWISHDMNGLYDNYLGPHWSEQPSDSAVWSRVDEIPHEEIWRTHERRRERLVAFARRRLRVQLMARAAPNYEVNEAMEVLDPHALTIGFARRFATYKRGALLFRDPERLQAILDNREFPVQVIVAGKAHPKDTPGKELIRKLIKITRERNLRRRLVFVEDYDEAVAHYMVQGCDVWLNTPRRPLEACGTSGMKAAMNCGLNMSTRDGWWDEAAREGAGWSIGNAEKYSDDELQDDIEGNVIYDLLEKEVVPLFYDRGKDGVPRGWTAMMRTSLRTLVPVFNSHRMVQDYCSVFYAPASTEQLQLTADGLRRARELAKWRSILSRHWHAIKVIEVDGDRPVEAPIGTRLRVTAKVFLGEISPRDVRIEIYEGRLDEDGRICSGKATLMAPTDPDSKLGIYEFAGEIPLDTTGQRGYSLRVLPNHRDLVTPFQPGFIYWAQ